MFPYQFQQLQQPVFLSAFQPYMFAIPCAYAIPIAYAYPAPPCIDKAPSYRDFGTQTEIIDALPPLFKPAAFAEPATEDIPIIEEASVFSEAPYSFPVSSTHEDLQSSHCGPIHAAHRPSFKCSVHLSRGWLCSTPGPGCRPRPQ